MRRKLKKYMRMINRSNECHSHTLFVSYRSVGDFGRTYFLLVHQVFVLKENSWAATVVASRARVARGARLDLARHARPVPWAPPRLTLAPRLQTNAHCLSASQVNLSISSSAGSSEKYISTSPANTPKSETVFGKFYVSSVTYRVILVILNKKSGCHSFPYTAGLRTGTALEWTGIMNYLIVSVRVVKLNFGCR